MFKNIFKSRQPDYEKEIEDSIKNMQDIHEHVNNIKNELLEYYIKDKIIVNNVEYNISYFFKEDSYLIIKIANISNEEYTDMFDKEYMDTNLNGLEIKNLRTIIKSGVDNGNILYECDIVDKNFILNISTKDNQIHNKITFTIKYVEDKDKIIANLILKSEDKCFELCMDLENINNEVKKNKNMTHISKKIDDLIFRQKYLEQSYIKLLLATKEHMK